jgi:OOP family OmpA-OmpF porin
MKKVVLPLLLICLSSASLTAQETQETTTTANNGYNKWSIEVAGGLNKPFKTFTPGATTNGLNPFHVDLGVRYMFNNKFGLKMDFGYNKFTEAESSIVDFETTYLRGDLQGVINLGRVLNFEDWTNSIGLLAHAGGGIYRMSFDQNDVNDMGVNVLGGLTAQLKFSDRIVLTGDATYTVNALQNRNFDGYTSQKGVVDGMIFNFSLGLTFYLGKNETHADWTYDVKKDELAALEERLGSVETMMNDTDKDGVPDYLDSEPNSITGVMVDSKGRSIDKNNNGVPDELESYIEKKNAEVKSSVASSVSNEIADLINGGYVNVYFDFNQDQPNASSTNGINFLIKYLKENPSASADVVGYADEIGDSAYNKDLSSRRATNVKKILVDSGIEASRLNIVGNGEDATVNKDSKQARQVVRRVTFMIK